MKTLRARLFWSVGGVFLLIALLSYLIPQYFVRKDIDAASDYLNTSFRSYHSKIQKITSAWISYRFLETAAELDAVVKTMPVMNQDLWEFAASIMSSNPDLALVQVTEKNGETAVISSESGRALVPEWARDSQGRLWIRIPGSQQILATKSLGNRAYLLLEKGDGMEAAATLPYTPFKKEYDSFSIDNTAQQTYDALRWHENVVRQKAALIQTLAAHRKEGVGILKVSPTFETGGALLAQDIFSSTPVVEATQPGQDPFILFRKEGPYVDLMEIAKVDPLVAIGFSLSNITQQLARIIQRPILIYNNKELLQAFDVEGNNIPPHMLSLSPQKVVWKEGVYIPYDITIKNFTVSILTPESFLQTINRFLNMLRSELICKISFNLLLVSLALLAVALLVLARISKNITKPIALLARASEEIGEGKYENLRLPETDRRHDEVTVLTHSFEKMVVSLQEREKIRGVLNKVVSKEIASKVLSGSVELGGEERMVTLLFSDIRGFTPLSEKLQPRTLISLLNTYMTRMCRIIDETHGVVDKFVGDEIMALYGAPLDLANHAEKAVEAALLMLDDLERWNRERGERGPPITIGIGIHTGVAFSGNMGAENRLNYTVVGANVNLASRLCAAAEPMQILITEQTLHALPNPEKFSIQKLPPITLKGINQPVTTYSITH